MIKYRQALCLPILVSFCANAYAQNLVTNSDFENYTNCPTTGGVDGIELVSPWYSVTNGSVDYYNICSTLCPIPSRGQGEYQETFSGNGYAGLWFFSPNVNNVREYLQAPLSTGLLVGRNYRVEFYVNACNISQVYVNNMGLYLSPLPISTSGSEYLIDVSPQIYKHGNPIINDTLNWIKITSVYQALGGESYITIGNFRNDGNTQIENNTNQATSLPMSYYFVEDVLVEEITSPFWQYRDTSVYYGDSVLIGPAITGLDIDWYTSNMEFISNAPGIYVQPATSRNYIAKETFNGVETTHLVHVTVIGGAGVEENELENVAIFPNPSKGTFYLKGLPIGIEIAKTTVKIYNLSGQCVWSEKLPEGIGNNTIEINTSIENGVYVLELRDENGNVETRKIVIQK